MLYQCWESSLSLSNMTYICAASDLSSDSSWCNSALSYQQSSFPQLKFRCIYIFKLIYFLKLIAERAPSSSPSSSHSVPCFFNVLTAADRNKHTAGLNSKATRIRAWTTAHDPIHPRNQHSSTLSIQTQIPWCCYHGNGYARVEALCPLAVAALNENAPQ